MTIKVSFSRKLNAHVATIIKGTLLRELPSVGVRRSSFIGGGKHAFLFGGPVITWWRTQKQQKAEIALSRLIIANEHTPSLSVDWCVQAIHELLQQVCIDTRYFIAHDVTNNSAESLFDCLSVSLPQFSAFFCEALINLSRKARVRRLTVFPIMPNISGLSFFSESTRLGLIDPGDANDLMDWVHKNFELAKWNPTIKNFDDADRMLGNEPFTYLGISVEEGTGDWAFEQANINLRILLAVAIAVIFSLDPSGSLAASIALPPTAWIQFPEAGSGDGWSGSSSEPLLPHFASPKIITESVAREIEEWFDGCELLNPDAKLRINKCAYYVNLALNARGMVKFIFYYIALDSLFGKRHGVEAAIQRGIKEFSFEFADRSSWLFDLRNEIVHGGSRTLKEWPRYQKYVDHFDTEPVADIEHIAMNCLYRAARVTVT